MVSKIYMIDYFFKDLTCDIIIMNKTYTINTIEELFDVVNGENIERLCEDLVLSLYLHVELKKQISTLKYTSLNWTDDGISQAAVELSPTDAESAHKKITLFARFDENKPTDTPQM